MKRFVAVILSLWVLSATYIPSVVGGDPVQKDGAITFEPNVIPELEIKFVEEFFRFQWLENRFDLKLLIHCEGKNHSLRDFWEKTDRLVKWNELITKATESMYEFGYMITDIPPEIADNVEFLVWKIEGASFDVDEIELEEIEVFEEGYNITRFHLPDNLVLSYEDMYRYDFSVSHPNKLETKVHGVKGKTTWNLDPITFSGGIITVIGGTEGSELDFKDIWDADQAGGWNVVHNNNNTNVQFEFDARIVLGNGTVAGTTWFADTQKQIAINDGVFSAHYQQFITRKKYATLRLGTLVDASTKRTKDGCSLINLDDSYYYTELIEGELYASVGETQLYGCQLISNRAKAQAVVLGFGDVYESIFTGTSLKVHLAGNPTLDVYDLTSTNAYYGIQYPISIETTRFTTPEIGIYLYTSYGGTTIKDITIIGSTYPAEIRCYGLTVDRNIVNADFPDGWRFIWGSTNTAEVYRQYTFDLTVTTSANVPIENANVTLTYYGEGGGTHGTWLTNALGQIPQQTVTSGFYNQTGGDTIYSYNPYEITITKANYLTYQRNFTQFEEKSWNIALLTEANEDPTARFTFSPSNPSQNGDINFDASDSTDSDGTIASYSWTLGDGNTNTSQTFTHVYTSEGLYDVALTVTDDDAATNTFTQTVNVRTPHSMISPAPVITKRTIKTAFRSPLTVYPNFIELLQRQVTVTTTLEVTNTICTSNITMFYTVTKDATSIIVESSNKTFWIPPNGSKNVTIQFTASFSWKGTTSYTLSTYTVASLTKSQITEYPIIIEHGATLNLMYKTGGVAVLGFMFGLVYYVWKSKPKKKKKLQLPGGEIEW